MDKKSITDIANIVFGLEGEQLLIKIGLFDDSINYLALQKKLSTYSENVKEKKEKGVYYTPDDVCEFITANCFAKFLYKDFGVFSSEECIKKIKLLSKEQIMHFLLECRVFDPTSGSGEFLLCAFEIKVELLKFIDCFNEENILKVLLTIFGNDINPESNKISIFRLLLCANKYISIKNAELFVKIFTKNFSCIDMSKKNSNVGRFEILIGNPPYVEKSKYLNHGNLYTDVLKNASGNICENGSFGFIIPISFVSTPRMSDFRYEMELKFKEIAILNYADRPSCLFSGVHQKLTILFCSNNCSKKHILTSKYNYWYRNERNALFKANSFVELDYKILDCYPKVSSYAELEILKKVIGKKDASLYDLTKKGDSEIYLNMRGYFWTKAFGNEQKSSQYKRMLCDKEIKNYVLAILNSSMFFMYWVTVSDCWHITGKELKGFQVKVNNIDFKKYDELYKMLEIKLEETKEYVGTKQVDYVYKHKYCKNIIDKIDAELCKDYGFSKADYQIISNFAERYRIGE